MTDELQQLVRDAMELTGSSPPDLLGNGSPTLTIDALSGQTFYLVGLIGGKEVGKSALVNALVGEPITQTTSFGPGTETVVAYAHENHADALRRLLEREVQGQYRMVTHLLPHLTRQVLLDLPDIDSHWLSHVEITRRMLRHVLFPLWVQSVEKYADLQPQQLLVKVAEGNAAGNFLFCLNKADQLDAAAVVELREDYGRRIGRILQMDPPRVWMLSAARPAEFDLPELRGLLAEHKSGEIIRQSQELANRQQDMALMGWLNSQDLTGRSQRLARLAAEGEELLDARVGVPLLEQSLPALMDDPASRLALTDEVLAARVSRWPIVNLVHSVLTPVLAVVRRNVGAARTASLPDAEALVHAHLQPSGKPLSSLVRSAFAQLQQAHPEISDLYRQRKLWEDMAADSAVVQLRENLTQTVARQRDRVRQNLTGGQGVKSAVFAPLRWLLTIGAVLWFPLIQPLTQSLLSDGVERTTREFILLAVKIFSVNELLANLTFLAMYFFVLWVILRWDTQRRVARFARRWQSDSSDLSLTSQAMQWMDELLAPINQKRQQADTLVKRLQSLQGKP